MLQCMSEPPYARGYFQNNDFAIRTYALHDAVVRELKSALGVPRVQVVVLVFPQKCAHKIVVWL